MNVTRHFAGRSGTARPLPQPSKTAMGGLLLTCVAFGLAGCQPATNSGDTSPSATPLASPAPSVATPAASPTASPSPVKPAVGPVLYVPGKDDLLHPHAFSDLKDPAKNLNQLIALAPLYFPKGTRVVAFADNARHATVDLNAPFNDQKFYSRGESIAELAIYTLVNSAATFTSDPQRPVQLTVEGKPLSTLGEFDASDAMAPDHNLVAKP